MIPRKATTMHSEEATTELAEAIIAGVKRTTGPGEVSYELTESGRYLGLAESYEVAAAYLAERDDTPLTVELANSIIGWDGELYGTVKECPTSDIDMHLWIVSGTEITVSFGDHRAVWLGDTCITADSTVGFLKTLVRLLRMGA